MGVGICFVGSLLRTHVLKKMIGKKGSSKLLVTLLAIMSFLNISLEGLSSEDLNKVLFKSFVKEVKDKN